MDVQSARQAIEAALDAVLTSDTDGEFPEIEPAVEALAFLVAKCEELEASPVMRALLEADAARDRLRAAVDHYLKAEEAWFLTTNARPFDAQASARASRIKHKALDDLAALAALDVSETTKESR